MNSPEAVEGGEGPKCSMIALVRHRVGISRLHWSTFRLAPPIARTKAEVRFRSCSPGAGFRRRSAWAHILQVSRRFRCRNRAIRSEERSYGKGGGGQFRLWGEALH